MRIRKATRYICDYCSKGFWHKDDCIEHEMDCYKNPSVKSCWNCKSLLKDEGPWFCEEYEKDLCVKPEKNYEMKFKNSQCLKFQEITGGV